VGESTLEHRADVAAVRHMVPTHPGAMLVTGPLDTPSESGNVVEALRHHVRSPAEHIDRSVSERGELADEELTGRLEIEVDAVQAVTVIRHADEDDRKVQLPGYVGPFVGRADFHHEHGVTQ